MKKYAFKVTLVGYSDVPQIYVAENENDLLAKLIEWFTWNKTNLVTSIIINNLGEVQ